MNSMKPLIVTDDNLSRTWAKGFLTLMEPGSDKRNPAVITINTIDAVPLEDQAIRSALDESLSKGSNSTCGTVANTIFPLSYWNPTAPDNAEALFARYERAWPGIKKCPANKYGVYFRRLTAFAPTASTSSDAQNKEGSPVNQLRHIVATYKSGNHRKSALHAAIFDPTKDHTNSRQKGFPCLQQVAFTPIGDETMAITGFYATQFQYEKAYGNYLGLERLGRFMAQQLGLRLVQVVCVASIVERGTPSKQSLEPLAERLRSLLATAGVALDGDGQ